MVNPIINSKRRYDHPLVQKSKNKVNYCMNPSVTHFQHESSDFMIQIRVIGHAKSSGEIKRQIQSSIGHEMKE